MIDLFYVKIIFHSHRFLKLITSVKKSIFSYLLHHSEDLSSWESSSPLLLSIGWLPLLNLACAKKEIVGFQESSTYISSLFRLYSFFSFNFKQTISFSSTPKYLLNFATCRTLNVYMMEQGY